MDHGSQSYFIERARFQRRVSLVTLAVALVAFAPFLLLSTHAETRALVRHRIEETLRFGFEGREQFVRRIELQLYGTGSERRMGPAAFRPVIIPEAHRGGGDRANAPSDALRFGQVVHRGPSGAGDADADMMARALRRAGGTPVFRSEQLVVEHLVRPAYPEEARRTGLEGRVVVLALVDTLGKVASVELMSGEVGGLLEESAVDAVWQTRFRPYRVEGEARSVYAVFRFVFRLY